MQECACLADRLIHGQVTLAEDAEEKFILKKKLSVAERKIVALKHTDRASTTDSAGCDSVRDVEWAGGEDVQENETSLHHSEHLILVRTPIHVCKEEAEVTVSGIVH